MQYQDNQLKKFTQPPKGYEKEQIDATKEAIQFALIEYFQKTGLPLKSSSFEVFLQGSYKNKTNVARNSDVDLVVAYKDQFVYDVSKLFEAERKAFLERYQPPKVKLREFKGYVHRAMVAKFGEAQVDLQNKCLKLRAHQRYCEADVVPVVFHRVYEGYQAQASENYLEGIQLEAANGSMLRNYPKQHSKAIKEKAGATGGMFCTVVRMYKGIKADMVHKRVLTTGQINSFYLENLLYNVPNDCFKGNEIMAFYTTLSHLKADYEKRRMGDYVFASGGSLFNKKAWNLEHLGLFLNQIDTK